MKRKIVKNVSRRCAGAMRSSRWLRFANLPTGAKTKMLSCDPQSDSPVTIALREPGEDIELKAMAYCWTILVELNQVQRDRAVAWITARNLTARAEEASGR